MTRAEIIAIKKLPRRYVRDGTALVAFLGGKFVALNPHCCPIELKNGRWTEVKPLPPPLGWGIRG